MPWLVAKDGSHYCVYKKNQDGSRGAKVKCWGTRDEAVDHMRALYANVEQSLHTIPMYISKSSISDAGEMRWSAVSSDIDWDLYGERMSLELYKSMISKIQNNEKPPEAFREFVTSDYWQGGMPYLSIAHYSDGNGKLVPGVVSEIFIDGKQLKSRGTLLDNKWGRAVWKSLKEDEMNYKSGVDTDRIRISIAFLDLAHKHGENGKVFQRKSLSDKCQECQKGIGDKIYLDGYFVHEALTTVPVNPRTIMEAEDAMTKKAKPVTKKDDAESVVRDASLAEEIAATDALEQRSEVLVEMSDAEEDVQEDVAEGVEEPQVSKSVTFTEDEISRLVAVAVKSALAEQPKEKSPLEVSLDNLYNVVKSAVELPVSLDEKLQTVQPALESVGNEIREAVKKSMPDGGEPSAPDPNDTIMEMLQGLSQKLEGVATEVATMKAQVQTPVVEQSRVPVPRSIAPKLQSPQTPEVPATSVKGVVRRSVGL